MMEKKKGLGRGLESLLPSRQGSAGGGHGGVISAQVSESALSLKEKATRVGRPGEGTERTDALVGAREIPLELIERNPYQTRGKIDEAALEELAASIREQGVLQPVLVREVRVRHPQVQIPRDGRNDNAGNVAEGVRPVDPTLLADGARRMGHPGRNPAGHPTDPPFAVLGAGHADGGIRYQLMAGERRWLASQRAGLTSIPAVVKQVNDEQAMEITIIENLQREDLNPMEQARAFEKLSREFRLTQELIAIKTGKDRATIANFLRLLKLPVVVQSAIEEGTLSLGHGKVLMTLQNEPAEMVQRVAEKAIESGMSVRDLEEMVQRLMGTARGVERRPEEARDPNVKAAELELQRTLGCKVVIKDRGGKGKIILEYASLEDFDRVVEVLGGK